MTEVLHFAADSINPEVQHQAAFAVRRRQQGRFTDLHDRTLEEVRYIANAYIRGEINPTQFSVQMQTRLDIAMVDAYLSGKRTALGRNDSILTLDDQRAIKKWAARQTKHLSQFQRDLKSQTKYDLANPKTRAWVRARAGMYADSLEGLANIAFVNAVEQMAKKTGTRPYYRWILGEAEHCVDCVAEGNKTADQPRPLDLLARRPGDGSTACLTQCRCRIEIVTGKRRKDIVGPPAVDPQRPSELIEEVA